MSTARRALLLCSVATVLVPSASRAAVFPVSETPLVFAGPTATYATLDHDGDGASDVAWIDDRLRLVHSGPAGFSPAQSVELPDAGYTISTAAIDLTGDGRDEFLAAFGTSGTLIVVRGRADRSLRAPEADDRYQLQPAITGYGRPTALDVGDVDGDGDIDVVAGIGVKEDYWYPPNSTDNGEVAVMLNDGHGHLTRTAQTLAVNAPTDIELVPVSGADPDLIVLQQNRPATGNLKRFPAAPGATFGTPDTHSGGELAWGDFNRDGFGDLVTAGETLRVLPGPSLGPALTIPGVAGKELAVADLDADGRQDLYVARGDPPFYGGSPRPLFLHATAGFSFVPVYGESSSTVSGDWRPTVADVDDDGKLDVVSQGASMAGTGLMLRVGLGPQLVPSPDQLEFDNQAVGTSSAPRTVTFTNEGGGRASGIEAQVADDAPDFAVDAQACGAATLEVGQSCAIDVRFTPTGGGLREAGVALFASDSDLGWVLGVAGHGFTRPIATSTAMPTPTPTPTASPSPRPAALTLAAPKIGRVTLRGLLRSGLRIRQQLPAAGRARWTLKTTAGSLLGTASTSAKSSRMVSVTLRASARGRRTLERHRPRRLVLRIEFTDTTGRHALRTVRLSVTQ